MATAGVRLALLPGLLCMPCCAHYQSKYFDALDEYGDDLVEVVAREKERLHQRVGDLVSLDLLHEEVKPQCKDAVQVPMALLLRVARGSPTTAPAHVPVTALPMSPPAGYGAVPVAVAIIAPQPTPIGDERVPLLAGASKFCQACGKSIPAAAQFCPSCGGRQA